MIIAKFDASTAVTPMRLYNSSKFSGQQSRRRILRTVCIVSRPIFSDRCGATAIEYAMVAFFISIAAVAALNAIGTDVTNLFSQIASSF